MGKKTEATTLTPPQTAVLALLLIGSPACFLMRGVNPQMPPELRPPEGPTAAAASRHAEGSATPAPAPGQSTTSIGAAPSAGTTAAGTTTPADSREVEPRAARVDPIEALRNE